MNAMNPINEQMALELDGLPTTPFHPGDVVRRVSRQGKASIAQGETDVVLYSTPHYTFLKGSPWARLGTSHFELVTASGTHQGKVPTPARPKGDLKHHFRVVGPEFSFVDLSAPEAEERAAGLARLHPGVVIGIEEVRPFATVMIPANPSPLIVYAKRGV